MSEGRSGTTEWEAEPRPDHGGRGQTGGDMQKCPQCGGEDCTHIVINLKEEDSVQFYACRKCEAKWWEHEGDTIALDEVLDLAAKSESR